MRKQLLIMFLLVFISISPVYASIMFSGVCLGTSTCPQYVYNGDGEVVLNGDNEMVTRGDL